MFLLMNTLVLLCRFLITDALVNHHLRPGKLNSLTLENSIYTKKTQLLDLRDFQFILSPRRTPCTDKLYFLVLVHSRPDHFKERELIRRTWGSVTKLQGWQVRTVFLLGKHTRDPGPARRGPNEYTVPHKEGPSDYKVSHRGSTNSLKSRSLHENSFFKSDPYDSELYKADSTDKLVKLESDLHNDIIQGSFDDTLMNLTYKHVMGYKWVEDHCPNPPKFVLKSDDDVFVEMYHLFNFVSAVYGPKPGPSLVCDVIPAGTAPHKAGNEVLAGDTEFFSKKMYPKYCSGAAYLITPSLMSTFLQATHQVPSLLIDDVYMTGLVREYLGVSPFYLNLRYTYELDRPTKWLHSNKNKTLPFIFVVNGSTSNRDWSEMVRSLWNKSEDIQLHHYRK